VILAGANRLGVSRAFRNFSSSNAICSVRVWIAAIVAQSARLPFGQRMICRFASSENRFLSSALNSLIFQCRESFLFAGVLSDCNAIRRRFVFQGALASFRVYAVRSDSIFFPGLVGTDGGGEQRDAVARFFFDRRLWAVSESDSGSTRDGSSFVENAGPESFGTGGVDWGIIHVRGGRKLRTCSVSVRMLDHRRSEIITSPCVLRSFTKFFRKLPCFAEKASCGDRRFQDRGLDAGSDGTVGRNCGDGFDHGVDFHGDDRVWTRCEWTVEVVRPLHDETMPRADHRTAKAVRMYEKGIGQIRSEYGVAFDVPSSAFMFPTWSVDENCPCRFSENLRQGATGAWTPPTLRRSQSPKLR